MLKYELKEHSDWTKRGGGSKWFKIDDRWSERKKIISKKKWRIKW